jgi:NAD(P)-dependent dehydrogenase (short-subunit alcohol dehydrogenase family)
MPVTISDSLAGRRALVTGGSKGTGAAIVRRLAEAGATVMTTARTMPGSHPDPGLFVVADISTPGGAQQVIDRVGERVFRNARYRLPGGNGICVLAGGAVGNAKLMQENHSAGKPAPELAVLRRPATANSPLTCSAYSAIGIL